MPNDRICILRLPKIPHFLPALDPMSSGCYAQPNSRTINFVKIISRVGPVYVWDCWDYFCVMAAPIGS
jgi:hypothetical protein